MEANRSTIQEAPELGVAVEKINDPKNFASRSSLICPLRILGVSHR